MSHTNSGRRLAARLLAVALCMMLALPALAQGDRHPDDINWYGGFGPSGRPGLNGPVHCSIEFEGMLVVGGEFTEAGGETVNHIAGWDGAGWQGLGEGFSGAVLALTIHEGQLYAGGEFLEAEGATVNYLAVWDGESWSDVHEGVNNTVHALISHDGYLWVGGAFNGTIYGPYASCKVMRYDGDDWVATGGTGNCYAGAVLCFAVYQTAGADPILAAGGSFTTLGGGSCDGVSWWQGDNWMPLSGGVDGVVHDMVAYEDKLLIGGDFGLVDGLFIDNLATWDGTEWGAFDAEEPDDVVRSLRMDEGTLHVGGDFENVGAVAAARVAAFDGADWTAEAVQCDASVRELAVWEGLLFAGGDFTVSGGTDVDYIGALYGTTWTPLLPAGFGANDHVYAICEYAGEVVVGGSFTTVGGEAIPYLASTDGGLWHDLGGGVNGAVYGLGVWDGKLAVGGQFTDAGGVAVSNVALWDGSTWSDLDGGVDAFAWKLIEHGGDLIVGGNFVTAGGASAERIARWDGSAWHALGEGLSSTCYGLLSHEGQLYATGNFSWTGQGSVFLHKVGVWDGSAWAAVGNALGTSGTEIGRDLKVFDGEIYLAGQFSEIDGLTTSGIAKWTGTEWASLGLGAWAQGYTPGCQCLSVYHDRLVVGGNFDKLYGNQNSVESGDIAFWDGTRFQALGSAFEGSISNNVKTMQVFADILFVGGYFHEVAGKPSYHIASWGDEYTPVALNAFEAAPLDGGVRLRWEISAAAGAYDLRLLRAGAAGETEIAFDESAPGVYAATDRSETLWLGGEFTYRLLGRAEGEDWQMLASETLSLAASGPQVAIVGAYPNPFNPRTTVRVFSTAAGRAKVSIYDVAGRLVKVLHDGALESGVNEFVWLGVDASGSEMSSGVYHALLETKGARETKRLVLVR